MLNAPFYLLLVPFIIVSCGDVNLERQKRSFLIFPMGGTFKLVCGLAIPVKLGTKQSMAYGVNMQFQYSPPTNYTQLRDYPPIVAKREAKGASERSLFYLGLETIMNRHGLNGKCCILRGICENAMQPLHHEVNGLYGHLLHIILTPDYGDGEADPDLYPDYADAYRAGKYGVDCRSLYPSCPGGQGILDAITRSDFRN